MFKLFVLACLLVVAIAEPKAKPEVIDWKAVAYTAPLTAAYTAPLAYSAYTAPLAYSAYTAPIAAYSAYSYASPYSAYLFR